MGVRGITDIICHPSEASSFSSNVMCWYYSYLTQHARLGTRTTVVLLLNCKAFNWVAFASIEHEIKQNNFINFWWYILIASFSVIFDKIYRRDSNGIFVRVRRRLKNYRFGLVVFIKDLKKKTFWIWPKIWQLFQSF